MRDFLTQIKNGLDANLYLLSLFSALAIPDLCGAMSSENGEANPEKYKTWFDKYVAPKYNGFLSGNDCYFFRCSLLHQGSSQHPNNTYKRVLFVEPSTTTNVFHNNIMNDALNIDVRIFCNDITEGAEKWLDENEETELYKKNYDKFMRRYPNGLSPYIVGVPVIS
ncbi:MAG: hypothetical protein COX43_02405 [Parcubacteria group bacterium CG23_combo_of_CG06-09_8_20_14_all_35_9]|nr:MAG: hypothetical protein COX43_02405 [Parcubacteria group bacterium CG23_combo_of_CG06-09_8_20_14_all_35_9]